MHGDYSFVCPVVRAHGDSDVVARTVIRRYLTVTVADPRQWLATEGRLWGEAWT
ncbi:membrane protein [Streptomyces azureus]|uniref:Membrane protein n=1 Tax=Streptomyces azureus TaxID=146537 RepID=A0A0K8PMJ0_STRAJ|nr:membrane protein [Streptomyces azureus]